MRKEIYKENFQDEGVINVWLTIVKKDPSCAAQQFYDSSIYKTDGCEHKGSLCDDLTPLDFYIADTLHLGIKLGDTMMHGIVIYTQHIEDLFNGLGVHAFFGACVLGGLRHFGSRMKQHAKVAWKGKVRSLIGTTLQEAESSKCNFPAHVQTEAGAVVKEFRSSLPKKSMSRLKDIINRCPRECHKRKVKQTNSQEKGAKLTAKQKLIEKALAGLG